MPLPRVTEVRALPGYRLAFRLKDEKGRQTADLTGLVHYSKVLAPLRDPARFAEVRVVDFGVGVAWGDEDDPKRLDLSAETLRRIALYQRPMSGTDFHAWRNRLRLSHSETAVLLGISARTVTDYQNAEEVPAVAAIACRAIEADPQLLLARFRPSAPAGRPRAKAAEDMEAARKPRRRAAALIQKQRSRRGAD